MKTKFTVILFVLIFGELHSQSIDTLLHRVLRNVNELKSVSYISKINKSNMFYKLAVDTNDKYVGARFLAYEGDSTKLITSYHDGIEASYFWNYKLVVVDTFGNKFVSLMSPFPIQIRELLKYSIKNKNVIKTQLKKNKNWTELTFTFNNSLVDFSSLSKPIRPSTRQNTVYVLTIDTTLMPIRLSCQIDSYTRTEAILRMENYPETEIIKKQQSILLPEGFVLKDSKNKMIVPTISENQAAPQFALKNLDGATVQLKDYLGENILIEFTSLGCSACEAAIPFLKKFAGTSKKNGFKFLSIMSFTDDVKKLKAYKKKNKLDYEILIADEATTENYKIEAVPVFVLINKKGIIVKANLGYGKGETDKVIIELAEKMMASN